MKHRRLLLTIAVVLALALVVTTAALAANVIGVVSATKFLETGFANSLELPVYLEAGDHVRATAVCTDGNADPYLDVYDPNGDYLTGDDDNYTACIWFASAIVHFEAPMSGTYLFEAWNWIGYDDGLVTLEVMRYYDDGIWDPGDGRLNPHEGAPVAIYDDPLAVWGIDVNTATGSPAFVLTDAEIAAAGVPVDAPVLLAEGVNPFTLQPITLYRMPTGAFQLNTYYWDGKPYNVQWFPGDLGVEVIEW